MKMSRFFYILFIVLFYGSIFAQDMTFSQFYHNPTTTNPALSVVFSGKNRAGTSMKQQWFTIEKNKYISLTSAFYDYKLNIIKNDYLSLGVSFLDERMNGYGKTKGFFNIAYSKLLNRNKYTRQDQYLIYGIQAGFGKIFLNNSFVFGSQFDKIREIPDITIPSGEEMLDFKTFADINMGLMWYLSGRNRSIYVGVAANHINKPDISLWQNSQFELRYSVLLGGEIQSTKEISILPAVNMNFQNPLYQIIGGANIRYEYEKSDNNAFRLGLWTRLSNSVDKLTLSDFVISTILEFNRIELGLSFDVNISELSVVTGSNSSFELSLLYTWGNVQENFPDNCPRF